MALFNHVDIGDPELIKGCDNLGLFNKYIESLGEDFKSLCYQPKSGKDS